MDKGWICPKCGRILSPYLDTCKYCNTNYIGGCEVAPNLPDDIRVDYNGSWIRPCFGLNFDKNVTTTHSDTFNSKNIYYLGDFWNY